MMAQAFDAEVDEQGQVRLLSPMPAELRGVRRRAVVVLLDAVEKTVPSGSRYDIVKQLGVGGMGAVYLARDRGTGRNVCLKRLSVGIDLRNVRQECAALERLQHPGIVGLIDRSLEGDAPFLVMEHAAGVDLSRYLRRRGPLPQQSVVPLLARVLEALDYAHSQQVIHRDLKPSNVMVQFNWQTGRLEPKILDFGIAIVGEVDYQGAHTGQGNPFGTPNYMSPEQMRGEVITPASDLYALGQMAWELATGEPAFTGHAREIAIRKVTGQGGLQLPEITRFDVSADFRRWIETCTQTDVRRRPSVREALAELQRMERALPAGVSEGPTYLAIEDTSQGVLPGAWCDGTGFVGGASAQVQFAFPAHQAHNFRKITMRLPAGSAGFGCLAQRVSALPLQNRELMLLCRVRPRIEQPGWAGIWVRAEGGGRVLAFLNSKEQPQRVSSDLHQLQMTVPPGSEVISFGALLEGAGEVDLSNFVFSVTPRTPQTQMLQYSLWEERDLLSDEELRFESQLT